MGLRRGIRNFNRWFIPEVKYIFSKKKDIDYKNIPVVINNFNRCSMLQKLIAGLESRGYRNIHIIDNGSDYPPLLEYYGTIPYPVYLLRRNVGYLAIWETGLYKLFNSSYFVYTDPDIEIDPDCPDDFMEKFVKLSRRYPRACKVGFSLRIDDLPEHFKNKSQVIEWESRFWKKEIEKGAYRAPIDTTFALYKPLINAKDVDHKRNVFIRTGYPYTSRHLPWYIDNANLSEEEQYYIDHIRQSTHWSVQNK